MYLILLALTVMGIILMIGLAIVAGMVWKGLHRPIVLPMTAILLVGLCILYVVVGFGIMDTYVDSRRGIHEASCRKMAAVIEARGLEHNPSSSCPYAAYQTIKVWERRYSFLWSKYNEQ